MTVAKTKPQAESEAVDVSELTIEERLERVEKLLQTVADHQAKLGTSLIRAHANMIEISGDLAHAGIGREANQPSILQTDRAPLIDPGGHPLRKVN